MSAITDWGSTAAERATPLPCDGLLPAAGCRLHRAVSVGAPLTIVYRWLCQLSLAPYSYDLVDNRGRRSPRELVPGADRLVPGQRVMTIFTVSSHALDDHLTLSSRRTAVTYAVRPGVGVGAGTVRLLVRLLFDAPGGKIGAPLLGRALALGDLVMMRKQLLTLKALAERDGARPPLKLPPRLGHTV